MSPSPTASARPPPEDCLECKLIGSGALRNVRFLNLDENQISNVGMSALATAVRAAAADLPSIISITARQNPGTDSPVLEAVKAGKRRDDACDDDVELLRKGKQCCSIQ